MVEDPSFLRDLFPIINVSPRPPWNVDKGQMRGSRGGQINDSFTCSHCKNDGFDAITGAKDDGGERKEIYSPNGSSSGTGFNIRPLRSEIFTERYYFVLRIEVSRNLEDRSLFFGEFDSQLPRRARVARGSQEARKQPKLWSNRGFVLRLIKRDEI